MAKIGAVYCVYEDSGFLEESITRIYPLMDKIVILIGFKPWNGAPDPEPPKRTYSKCLSLSDPANKIEIVSRVWATEHEQRNFGLEYLRSKNIEWCFIIDDDEMYNYEDLKKQLQTRILESSDLAITCPHQIYWKRTDLVIENIQPAMPAFARTNGHVWFTDARCLTVDGGTWSSFQPFELVCHHYSYVRSDEQMWHKITRFSHAAPYMKTWYDTIWMGWTPDKENLSPNVDNPGSLKRAIPAHTHPFILEPLNVGR